MGDVPTRSPRFRFGVPAGEYRFCCSFDASNGQSDTELKNSHGWDGELGSITHSTTTEKPRRKTLAGVFWGFMRI